MEMRFTAFYALVTFAMVLVVIPGCKIDCAGQNLDECSRSDECSVIRAGRITSECVEAPTAAGCTDRERQICGDALTVARDQTGAEWQFPSTCIPEGWTPVRRDAYPECE